MFSLRYSLFFVILVFLGACNHAPKGESPIKEKANEISNIPSESEFPQLENKSIIDIESDKYRMIQKGTYSQYSTRTSFIRLAKKEIERYQFTDTTFLDNNHCMYLANDQPIALFNNMYPSEEKEVAGIFTGGSLVHVDTIFYNNIYLDSDKAPMSFEKWFELLDKDIDVFERKPLTYDVWYAIRINGELYYTDYKLHNLLEYKTYIADKEQMFLICSQATGYDGIYDRGYPDYYEIAVFQKPESTDKAWKQIYRSSKLDLNAGGLDEFGLMDLYLNPPVIDTNGNLVIKWQGNWSSLIWDGEQLSIDWNKE